MPICPKCGKNLSTQQSLEYHLSSKNCENKNFITTQQHSKPISFDISFTCDCNGIITDIDNESADKLEFNRIDMIGTSGYNTILDNDKFYVSQYHIRALSQNFCTNINYRRVKKNKEVVCVNSSSLLMKKHDEILFVINERILPVEHETESRFTMNFDGKITSMNQNYTKIYGYTLQDQVNDTDLWHSEDLLNHLPQFRNLISGIDTFMSGTIRKLNYQKKYLTVYTQMFNKGNFIFIQEKLCNNNE